MQQFVLIDGSYFIFYRYYALVQWWNLAKKDIKLTDPINNEEFVKKFRQTFVSKTKDIAKTLKIDDPIIIVGKDCPRKDIWRMKLLPEYKGTRVNDGFEGGPFFKMAYGEKLFEEGGASMIMYHKHLEADDCIAITTNRILEAFPESKVTIITSDHDYLQLVGPRVQLYSLKYKNLLESKKAYADPKKNLFCKIVSGDKSDNIPGIFKRCGIKTIEKCYEDQDMFMEKCKKEEAGDQFELNNTLINFNKIPEELVSEFMASNWIE